MLKFYDAHAIHLCYMIKGEEREEKAITQTSTPMLITKSGRIFIICSVFIRAAGYMAVADLSIRVVSLPCPPCDPERYGSWRGEMQRRTWGADSGHAPPSTRACSVLRGRATQLVL